jgi:hypothetical protein
MAVNQIFIGNTANPLPQTDFLEQQPINRPTRAWIQFFLNMMNNTSAPTATTGSATLPANPAGFMNVTIDGKPYKVPYYNP